MHRKIGEGLQERKRLGTDNTITCSIAARGSCLPRTRTANSSMPLTRACARRFSTGSSRHDFALGPPFSAPAVSPVAPCPQGSLPTVHVCHRHAEAPSLSCTMQLVVARGHEMNCMHGTARVLRL